MADQNEAKTKTIGFLPIEKVQTLKGWDEYLDKSTQLSILRTEAQKAKNAVRDALKERLNDYGDIDFVGEGDRIRVFRVFRKQQARRTRSLDLSASFREQPLEGKAETNSHDAGVCEETDDATPNTSPHNGRRCGHAGPRHGASHGHHARERAKVSVARMKGSEVLLNHPHASRISPRFQACEENWRRGAASPLAGEGSLTGLRSAQHRRSESKNAKAIFANDISLTGAPRVAPASDMDTGAD